MTAEPEMRLEPCGGCGETNPSARCIGCLHDFVAAPAPQEGERERIVKVVAQGLDQEWKDWEIADAILAALRPAAPDADKPEGEVELRALRLLLLLDP